MTDFSKLRIYAMISGEILELERVSEIHVYLRTAIIQYHLDGRHKKLIEIIIYENDVKLLFLDECNAKVLMKYLKNYDQIIRWNIKVNKLLFTLKGFVELFLSITMELTHNNTSNLNNCVYLTPTLNKLSDTFEISDFTNTFFQMYPNYFAVSTDIMKYPTINFKSSNIIKIQYYMDGYSGIKKVFYMIHNCDKLTIDDLALWFNCDIPDNYIKPDITTIEELLTTIRDCSIESKIIWKKSARNVVV